MTDPVLARARARVALLRAERAAKAGRAFVGPDPTWGQGISRARGYTSSSREELRPMEASEALYRCVTLQARTLAGIPTRAMLNGDDLPRDHPLAKLLQRPNPHQSRREFVEAVFTTWLLDGELFLACVGADGGPARLGELPAEWWPVPGALVQEDVDPKSKLVLGWGVRDSSSGQVTPWPVHALLPCRFWNPYNPLRGLSPLKAAARGIRVNLKASAHTEALYDNGGEPGGLLKTEQRLTKGQRDAMRTEWNDRHQGVDKAGRVAVLEGGLSYQSTVSSPKDLGTSELRAFSVRQVAMVYGVPMLFLNETEDMAYATARAAMRVLWENTLLPLKGGLEDVLASRLFVYVDARLSVELDVRQVEALRDDLNTRLEAAERYARLGVSTDETSVLLNLGIPKGAPGRDVGLVQQGLAPIELVASGMLMASGLDPDEPDPPSTPQAQGGEGGKGGDPEHDPDAMPQGDKAGNVKGHTGTARDAAGDDRERARAARWHATFRSVMGPAESSFRRRVQGWVRGRRAEVLAALERLNRSRALDREEVARWLDDARLRWREALGRQVGPLYPRVAEAAAKGLLPDLGHPFQKFTMGSPRMLEFLARKDVLVTRVSDTVLEDVRQAVMEGIDEAEPYQRIQDRVRGSFNTTMSRSLTIARTEAAQTVNGARNVVMREEGVQATEWLTARDGNVREEHQPLDGRVVPIGESFVPDASLEHPGDTRAPARLVVNCRCVAVPATAAGQ